MKNILMIIVINFYLGVAISIGCSSSFDCQHGSTCFFKQGEIDGICLGGKYPGNENDLMPPSRKKEKTYGEKCYFDNDCDSGSCVKSNVLREGVCL